MTNIASWWVIILLIILIDVYVFFVLRFLMKKCKRRTRAVVYTVYWVVSALCITAILLFPYILRLELGKTLRNYVTSIVAILFFAKLIACIFFLVDDIRRSIVWLIRKLRGNTRRQDVENTDKGQAISRSAFLSWVGMAAGGGLLGSFMYGFTNKYNYKIFRQKLSFPNLPVAFKGLKIVQLSDIHSGSFNNKQAVNHGIDMVLAEKPDIILFTGDLVNDKAIEMDGYMDVFSRLTAPMGVFSVLGNHDYGDYVRWTSPEAKAENLESLKQLEAKLGWRLLMNEHVVLEKDGQQIALLGIENWSARGHFPKYGRMDLAYPGTEKYPFKILMSHDPSHWDAEVRVKYPDIDLMLSGHTHGMQFGVELPHFKWSPVQWIYKEWAGLYKEGNQYLYVNRGYGFIGYPGRVGIMPEITVIELA